MRGPDHRNSRRRARFEHHAGHVSIHFYGLQAQTQPVANIGQVQQFKGAFIFPFGQTAQDQTAILALDDFREPRPRQGRVLFESTPAQNAILDVVPRNRAINRSYLLAEAPDYRFEKSDLRAGDYSLKPRSESFYVKSPRKISVTEGHVEPVEIILSSEFARIDGRVQDSRGDARTAPREDHPVPFVVAIRGGRRRAHAAQLTLTREWKEKQRVFAGFDGAFSSGKLKPGDYQLGVVKSGYRISRI